MKKKGLLSRISSWPKAPLERDPSKEDKSLPRVVIEQVTPSVDGGRYAAKRRLGSTVEVAADIFKDGHDLIAARVLLKEPGSERARPLPLHYRYDEDRWFASFQADVLGLFEFTIEAWPDWFSTWKADLKKRIDAGQDIESELAEGSALLRRKAEGAGAATRARLQEFADALTEEELEVGERTQQAFDAELADAMYGPLEPADSTFQDSWFPLRVDAEVGSFSSWYEMFPRSLSTIPGRHGTFRDAERRLEEVAALGFDVVYLPPISPIGVTHRKGRNNARTAEPGDAGSPWAIGSKEGGHTAIHPELGTLEDFQRFVTRASELGLKVALDYALQCSPDHPWAVEHPEWFFIRPDGSIRYAENPPKKYQDIYPINFWCEDRVGLWTACRDIFLFWIDVGVRVFRVDNPHTKPLAFWEWVIADVQRTHPDVIFLAEAFTRPKRMYALAKLGFSQSYSYFTWKNTKSELTELLTELSSSRVAESYRPNFFANTPDILHEFLQKGGRPAFRIRLVLAATLSPVYGIYSGFELCENTPLHEGSEEYFNSEKYQLVERDFSAEGHLNDDIVRLNRLRREQPALREMTNLVFLETESVAVIAYHKRAEGSHVVCVVNLDPHHTHEAMLTMPLDELGIGPEENYEVLDLLTGISYTWRSARNYVRLEPEQKVAHVFLVQRA